MDQINGISHFPSWDIQDEKRMDKLFTETLNKSKVKIVVLDDDPTGIQTVHGIYVYTNWGEESFRAGFANDDRVFYILTNSRAMSEQETRKIHEWIGDRICQIAQETDQSFLLVSRSDSTLRGHFPLETQTLADALKHHDMPVDGEIICPAFFEGGRYTFNETHYVRQGDKLIPAAHTEFAKDPFFGYTNSHLPHYIEEKTKGDYAAGDVVVISLEQLRSKDTQKIVDILMTAQGFAKYCVEAIEYSDLRVFAIALYQAMAGGKRFIVRSAASLVKALGHFPQKELLTKEDLVLGSETSGGLIMVGSYTEKSTSQVEEWKTHPMVEAVHIRIAELIKDNAEYRKEKDRCVEEAKEIMLKGKTAVCYTTRGDVFDNKEYSEQQKRDISLRIRRALIDIVKAIHLRPKFVVAKGGITSSDIGVEALGVAKAFVLGQVQPGVPVWKTDAESRMPNIPYIIFPGNVGEEHALLDFMRIMYPECKDS